MSVIEALEQRIERLEAERDRARTEAERLWKLLDDIDTYGDMLKPEHTVYFKKVCRKSEERFGIITSDGYKLIWTDPPNPT